MTGDHETHALYRFHDADGALLYVGMTADPSARFRAHKKGKSWWHEVSAVTVEKHPTRAATLNAERLAIVTEKPLHNVCHNSSNPNREIFMITDGQLTCLKICKNYYKNSFGLDRKIVTRCLSLALRCKKLDIPITTFMIARDQYLMRFVEAFTQTNNGKAFYSSLDGLGSFALESYKKRKKK